MITSRATRQKAEPPQVLQRLATVSGGDRAPYLGTELVADTCRQMSESHVDSVLVVDEQKRLEGTFIGHGAVRRVIDSDWKSTSTHLADDMTPHPVTMRTDNSAIEALRLKWDCGFEHVPVVANGQVIGVVSQSDFGNDEKIELEREYWEHMR